MSTSSQSTDLFECRGLGCFVPMGEPEFWLHM